MKSTEHRGRGYAPGRIAPLLLALIGLSALPEHAPGWTPTEEKQIIRLPLSTAPTVVDGAITGNEYDDAVILGGAFKGWGVSPRPQSPTVYLKRDKERLYILYDNPLKEGERPTMRGAVPDNSGICMGNAVELFFLPHLPDGELLKYIQFIGNARGCVYDAISTPQVGFTYVAEYTKPWLFKNRIVPGHWYSEISTTFEDIKIRSTANGEYFDFDCGRDGGTGANGVHSYTMAYHLIQSGNGVNVIFDEEAPVAQWLSFGEFESNTFNPRLRLKSMGRADTYKVVFLLTEAEPQQDKSYREIFRKEFAVRLGAGESKQATVSFALSPKSKGTARYRITDGQGQVIFYRELGYEAGATAAPLYPKTKPEPMVATASMAPSYGRFGVSADIIDYPGDKSQVVVEAAASREGSEKPLGTVIMDRFQLDYAQGILDVGAIEEGTYHVTFRALDRATKTPLGREKEITLVRKIYEWENNDLGVSDKVIHPWTPMKMEGAAVHCWGRRHTFTGLGLPRSIPTLQPEPSRGPAMRDVLAGPVRLVAETGGKILAWKEGECKITGTSETAVSLAGSADAPGLRAELNGTLDYDGFYKIRLKITPTVQTGFDSIRVEVPLPTAGAGLFHSVGESMRHNKTFADFEGKPDGVLWDSKTAARNAVIKGNFLPVAWLGDDDRGIAWMCDNDRTWQITFDEPCLDVVRIGGETTFRMHLLNRPGKVKEPIEVTFGLQATPFRPRRKGGSWKKVEWYGWSQFDKPLLWHQCFDPYREGKGYKWLRTEKASKEDLWWRYGCLNSDRIDNNDESYGQIIKDFGAEWYCDSIWMKVQNKAHQDFELWAYKQWCEIGGMDGVYFDNTFPSPSINLLNGTAYVDEDGSLRSGYAVMAFRDYLKRLRTMFLSFGPAPVMMAHITDTPIPGYLGFCDFWLDGECGGYPDPRKKNPDFVDRWYNRTGMANLRTTLGRQWGTMPRYLYDWGIEPTHAVLGMLDLENHFKAMGKTPYHDFGRYEEDVEFIPYWADRPVAAVAVGGPDVLVTAWKRQGQARFLVSNLSDEDRTVDLRVDLKGLALPDNCVAVDEREGGALPFERGVVRDLAVRRHDYLTLIVARPGLHAPPAPDDGRRLQPARALWIKDLCDDFQTLSKEWTRNASSFVTMATDKHGVPGKAFDLLAGHVRIRTSSSIYANLSRPFDQDNCSVQLKLREPDGSYGGGFEPGLHLYWADGRSVHVTGWGRGPALPLSCHGRLGDKNAFSRRGPEPARISWVRIALKPDAIEFHTSTNGETWDLLHRQPRAGFEGAPAELALGHGYRSDGPREGYSFDSYYDDLVVARLPAKQESVP